MARRVSTQGVAVLRLLEGAPSYGYRMIEQLGIKSGSLYPLLRVLEERGLVDSYEELLEPSNLGRPRRRIFRITAAGRRELKAALKFMGVGA